MHPPFREGGRFSKVMALERQCFGGVKCSRAHRLKNTHVCHHARDNENKLETVSVFTKVSEIMRKRQLPENVAENKASLRADGFGSCKS